MFGLLEGKYVQTINTLSHVFILVAKVLRSKLHFFYTFTTHDITLKYKGEAGDVGQCLRVLAAPAEDLVFIPSI